MKHRSNNGQATIEFALVLPLFIFSCVLLFGILSACLRVLALNDTARAAVRVAVTADNPQEAVDALTAHQRVKAVVNEESNGIITVNVSAPYTLWFVAVPISALQLHASASMMREPPIVLS